MSEMDIRGREVNIRALRENIRGREVNIRARQENTRGREAKFG